MSTMDSLKELLQFLHLGARLDLKAVALQHLLDLSGTNEGVDLMVQSEQVLWSIISLMYDRSEVVSKDAALVLVNVSANEKGASKLIDLEPESSSELYKRPDDIVKTALKFVSDPETILADPACMILSNLTRPSALIDKVVDRMLESDTSFDKLVNIFTQMSYNKKGANLHYLGPVFSNLSQSVTVRRFLMDRKKCVVQRLLPFTEYADSVVRRGGIVGTLKNCCFDETDHEWLLSDRVDILPRLLLPLAGGEQFDDDDNEKLPIELQYLPDDKKREPDPDIRTMLLEALTQLCAKKENRTFIRDKNTYVVLRELHKWEKDRKALLACENLVDLLIRTEEEIAQDNIKELVVPKDLQDRFEKMDEEFLKDATSDCK